MKSVDQPTMQEFLAYAPIAFEFLVCDHGFVLQRGHQSNMLSSVLWVKDPIGFALRYELLDFGIRMGIMDLASGRAGGKWRRGLDDLEGIGTHAAAYLTGFPNLRSRPVEQHRELIRGQVDAFAKLVREQGGVLLEGILPALRPRGRKDF